MIKRFVGLFTVLFALTCHAQVTPDSIRLRLGKYYENYPQEKIYLHLDRPHYSPGDTIWLKAYIVEAVALMADTVSKNIYVDFFKKDNGKLIHRTILRNLGGYAHAHLVLEDTLSYGVYEIRAYTNWMRNFAEENFFKKDVFVRSNYRMNPTDLPDLSSWQEVADLQFFPEGGNLVTGMQCRVAFKALNKYGKGVDCKAFVFSEKEKEPVLTIQSKHLGMGTFIFTPKAGERYFATIEEADKRKLSRSFYLPEMITQGYTFFVDNLSNKDVVKVIAKNNFAAKDRPIIVVHQRGDILFAFQNPVEGNSFLWSLKKTDIPSDGIVQFTLLNSNGEPQSERLIYNDKKNPLQILITPDKAEYKPNEKVTLQVSVKSSTGAPVRGNFSLSVTDAEQIQTESNGMNIFNYLNLTSDVSSLMKGELKGTIEKPNLYFNKADSNAPVNLDILLMTQGWRRFLWQKVLTGRLETPPYEIETGISLKGSALRPNGKPTAKPVEISFLYHPEKGATEFLTTKTNAEGKFAFAQLDVKEETEAIIQGVKDKGGRDLLISQADSKSPPFVPVENAFDPSSEENRNVSEDRLKHYHEMEAKLNLGKAKVLQEVTVVAERIKDNRRLLYSGLNTKKVEVNESNCGTAISVFQLMQGRVPGVTINQTSEGYAVQIRGLTSMMGTTQPPAYLLDGFLVTLDVINSISPCQVESIEVVTHPVVVFNSNGLVSILTKGANPNYTGPREPSKGTLVTKIRGYHVSREFYSPKYVDSVSKEKNLLPDFRATLYWNPVVKTDAQGNASVTFWNSDERTSVHVSLEGISQEGQPAAATTDYKVD